MTAPEQTHADPLANIPDDLLRFDRDARRDRIRAEAMVRWIEARMERPSLLDLHQERCRRGLARNPTPADVLAGERHRQAARDARRSQRRAAA